MAFTAPRRIAMPVRTDAVTGTGTNWPDAVNIGNHLRIDHRDFEFHMLNDGGAAFYRFLSDFAQGEELTQVRDNWDEDDIQSTASPVASLADDSGANVQEILLDFPQMVAPNMKAINMRTQETIHIITVNAAGILTATRGAYGTTAATIVAGDIFNLIGPHLPEGGDPQAGRSHMPTPKFNWCAFYSATNSITDVQKFSNMLNDLGKLADSERKAMVRLMRMMDQDLRWSRKGAEDGSQIPTDAAAGSDGRIYTFDGLAAQIEQAITIPQGVTWMELNALFNPFFRASGSSPAKWLWGGPTLFNEFTQLMETRHNWRPAYEPKIGAVVSEVQLSEGGTLVLVNDIHGMSAQYGADSRGFMLDMPYVKQKTYNGMGLQVKDVTNPFSHHTERREIFASQTVQVKHAQALHATVTRG